MLPLSLSLLVGEATYLDLRAIQIKRLESETFVIFLLFKAASLSWNQPF